MLDPELAHAVIVVAACSLLAGLTYFRKILDLQGSILGFVMGLVIGLFGHLL